MRAFILVLCLAGFFGGCTHEEPTPEPTLNKSSTEKTCSEKTEAPNPAPIPVKTATALEVFPLEPDGDFWVQVRAEAKALFPEAIIQTPEGAGWKLRIEHHDRMDRCEMYIGPQYSKDGELLTTQEKKSVVIPFPDGFVIELQLGDCGTQEYRPEALYFGNGWLNTVDGRNLFRGESRAQLDGKEKHLILDFYYGEKVDREALKRLHRKIRAIFEMQYGVSPHHLQSFLLVGKEGWQFVSELEAVFKVLDPEIILDEDYQDHVQFSFHCQWYHIQEKVSSKSDAQRYENKTMPVWMPKEDGFSMKCYFRPGLYQAQAGPEVLGFGRKREIGRDFWRMENFAVLQFKDGYIRIELEYGEKIDRALLEHLSAKMKEVCESHFGKALTPAEEREFFQKK